MRDEIPVPVLMYHTVGVPDPEWDWNYLTCPYEVFDDQMKRLRKHGFVSVGLQDLYEAIFEGGELPRRAFVITFDDGYLDNWIFAFPILRKYGFRGTVFVSPEFADRRDVLRERLDQIGSAGDIGPVDARGFLSWREMAAAEEEGVLDIQPHAMTHTWYPVSDRIVDFRHPGDSYIWMTWNSNVEKKPYLQVDDERLVRLGEPVYEHGKSLSSPRYLPNGELSAMMADHVESMGGRDFFCRPDWRKELTERCEALRDGLPPGRMETEDEWKERIRWELGESKRIIEDRLGKRADFLCWPGGSGSKSGMRIAREIGFKMTTAANDMAPALRRSLSNLPSERSERIVRLPAGLYWDGKVSPDSKIVYDSGRTLVMNLLSYKKMHLAHIWGRLARKALKEYHGLTS